MSELGHNAGHGGHDDHAVRHAHGDHLGYAPHPSHSGHDDHDAHDHGSLGSYMIGFLLSVMLTAIPFWLVMGKVIANSNTAAVVLLGFAAVQVVVHMVYFLHMNAKSEGGWNMLALIFTTMLVVIAMSGSLWVMYHLNHNMMPMPAAKMRDMP